MFLHTTLRHFTPQLYMYLRTFVPLININSLYGFQFHLRSRENICTKVSTYYILMNIGGAGNMSASEEAVSDSTDMILTLLTTLYAP